MSKMIRYVALAIMAATPCLAQVAGAPASRQYVDAKVAAGVAAGVAVEAAIRLSADAQRPTFLQHTNIVDARIYALTPLLAWSYAQSTLSNELAHAAIAAEAQARFEADATVLAAVHATNALATAAIAAVDGRVTAVATNYLRAVEVEPGLYELYLVTE